MSEVPQVGDEGNSGLKEELTSEQVASIQAAQNQAKTQVQGQVAAGVASIKPEDTKSIIISENDRLKAENLHLKVIILAYKSKTAQEEYVKVQGELQEHQQLILQSQQELQEKYGIDLQTHEISSDGTVSSREQSNINIGQLMQHLTGSVDQAT